MADITAEIFAAGVWNDMKFLRADLDAIARNFAALADVHKVPLKFGHNDEQPMTDGQPALGWVSEVWVQDDEQGRAKLYAKLTDVPDVVAKAIEKKLYRKVSIELDFEVKHKDTPYEMVLSGVALLGADIPAVSTLADLHAFMARGADFSAGRRAAFSAIDGGIPDQHHGDDTMSDELKALSAKFDRLVEQQTAIAEANKALTDENAKLKAQAAEFERKQADAEKAAKAEQVRLRREEATKILDDAVKAEAITPAQRGGMFKILRIDDDDAVAALDMEAVKDLAKGAGTKRGGQQAYNRDGEAEDLRPDQEAAQRAQAMINEGKATDFATAFSRVLTADPKLARAYATMNGEK